MPICNLCKFKTNGRPHPTGLCRACRALCCPDCLTRLVPGPDVVVGPLSQTEQED